MQRRETSDPPEDGLTVTYEESPLVLGTKLWSAARVLCAIN